MISRAQNKPSSNIYFENLYNDYNIDWTATYTLPLITNNTYTRSFQYKILSNVLFLNKKLHTFGIKPSPLCSFCNLYDKTPYHMFCEYDCENNKCLSKNILLIFKLYVYKSGEKKLLNNLIAEIQKRKRIEKEIVLPNSKKTIAFTRK